jgi:hypothetical protein
MSKRVVVIVLVFVALLAYAGYNTYDAKRSGGAGEVFSNDQPGGKAKTDSVAKITGTVAAAGEKSSDSEEEPIVYPSTVQRQEAPATTTTPATAADGSQMTQTGQPAQSTGTGTAPEGDTISPNPPNGMVFSGTGKYQLYRQGNLTWRVNTETGQSCVLLATNEEWTKPQVYRSGCGTTKQHT